MKRLVLSLVVSVYLLCVAGACSQEAKPKLAVVIVVDQMRADHMTRFAGLYKYGFARLLNKGARFADAHHDHSNTLTGSGHASISTGVHPSKHGIVGNNWFDKGEAKLVYCLEDTTCPITGYDRQQAAAGRSPRRLLASALGDWIKARSPRSKVFGVARKDRSAVLSAGHKADGAYWYNSRDGHMVTSNYYAEKYPPWVDKFNESGIVDRYNEDGWWKVAPEESYFSAREDSFYAEADGNYTVFPHLFKSASGKPGRSYYSALQTTPFIDEYILEFSKRLTEEEELGADDATDLLFIGCSAADAIGHSFGPLSQESLDHFLRLDKYIGDFMEFLDDKLGKENYLVALTSDHGVLLLPEELARRGFASKRLSAIDFGRQLRMALSQTSRDLGIMGSLLRGLSGKELSIEYAPALNKGISKETLNRALIERLRAMEGVEDVIIGEDLAAYSSDGSEMRKLYRNSYYPDRSGDLIIRTKKHYVITNPRGTTHGSPYRYDTHVPLIFMGVGVPPGVHEQRVRTVDLAPTLAALLGVKPPTELDGVNLLR